jgi:hypothetical protein
MDTLHIILYTYAGGVIIGLLVYVTIKIYIAFFKSSYKLLSDVTGLTEAEANMKQADEAIKQMEADQAALQRDIAIMSSLYGRREER